MVSVMKKKPQPKQASIACPVDVRELAENVKVAGNYGTVTNALRTSLREQLERIKERERINPASMQSSE